jgi:uncharacterized protein
MNQKLLMPQEIETFYVLPTLRKHLAVYMKNEGMKQKDVALIMGVNTAAISQYLSSKRGNNIIFNNKILEEIKKSASLITNQFSFIFETQRLLKVIRDTKTLCQIHHQFSNLPDNCEPKNVGCNIGGCM